MDRRTARSAKSRAFDADERELRARLILLVNGMALVTAGDPKSGIIRF
jgi:hypothetical protein